jgi:endoglucanase
MRSRISALAMAALAAGLTACANTPDTTLDPDLPAISYVPLRHPFRDAKLYHDMDTAAARWQARNGADWLDPITEEPQARWLNSPENLADVRELARDARADGTLPVLVAYYLPNRGCSGYTQGAPTARAYDRWIAKLIDRLGSTRSVVVMEPDAVAADCFDAERAAVLRHNVRRLTDAGHYVYIDAGHAAWRSSGETAERLLAAGIQHAEGFAVNVANRQTTKRSYQFGRELSDLVGGREFVIDTSRNGLGPPPDEKGRDDEWCNPARQALGEDPTTDPGLPGVAALLWIKPPGESDGVCGGEKDYLFSPAQARTLISKATRGGSRWG